jgi:hypothetical protein
MKRPSTENPELFGKNSMFSPRRSAARPLLVIVVDEIGFINWERGKRDL